MRNIVHIKDTVVMNYIYCYITAGCTYPGFHGDKILYSAA